MKRILTVQDISCVGKCSLTVALPVISAMGAECAVLPTAVLSTHTAFKNFTVRDLTEDIAPIADVWERENIAFDCIYTGYLASAHQLELVSNVCRRFKGESTSVFVDPVMGDFGKLYAGFNSDFPREMRSLCAAADVILPNLTETCQLLDIDYKEDFTKSELREMAKKLCDLGAKCAVITGYSPAENALGVLKYDSETGAFFEHTAEKIVTPTPLHGTGDLFAPVCVGAHSAGKNLDEALTLAVDFTSDCVRHTAEDPDGRWYGVTFEDMLPKLWSMMK